ncbi:tetratricopeptide repeat protein [Sporolactobacillus sp. CQH2019]|uniref:tetratricopeptide repeat protein n=1 Tax=Sporolactobacillus sp. CQH2019 TaxID=3023512 RepID=UPI002368704E|nr:tetratricopeptide repeat protein [Sporolactobacillus sp. CQH2019]MDD9150340.1 tetratricopeptide repeat protein [Sporolactobacillus sp. CQH2019]
MENSTNSMLKVDLGNTDIESGVTFDLQVAPENLIRKLRRHRNINIQLYQEPNGVPLAVQSGPESSTYKNVDGEFDYSFSVRHDRMQVSIPYAVLPLFHYGDLVSARISLENSVTGEVLSHETLSLFVTKEELLTLLTPGALEAYIRSGISLEEQWEKTSYWLEIFSEDDEVLSAGIDLLKELAVGGLPEAEKKLYELYSDKTLSVYDEGEAKKWQERVEQKDQDASAAAGEGKSADSKDLPEKITDEAALRTSEQLAEEGNLEAMWMIFSFSLSPQGAAFSKEQAFSYLKTAAAGGYEQAVSVLADAFEKNYVFISKENAEDYLTVLESAAEKKLSLAEYLLFQVYYDGVCLGQPVSGDKKKAYTMLHAAAEDGSIEAAYRLWDFYENGNEFLMEQADALKWLSAAAEQGYAAAEARLGDLYIDGECLKKDNEKGLYYLGEAAEKNNWDAQMKQFQSYYEGRYKDILLQKDTKKAFALLRKFADAGNPKARMLIMEKYENGNEMMMEHREAAGYLKEAADAGFVPAMYKMANVLLDGLYFRQDTGAAKKLLNKAAAAGYPDAQFALYQYYFSGYKTLKNGQVNKERAYRWLLKAARTLPRAQYEIWLLAGDKKNSDLDITMQSAIEYLFRSAAQKYSPALYHVGMAFGEGGQVKKNTKRGITLIEEAVSLRNPEAMYTLSEIRTKGEFGGESVKQDTEDGLRLLLLSAELGYPPACNRVWQLYSEGNLAKESENWIQAIRNTAVEAGYEIKEKNLDGAKQEIAGSKESE